MSQKIRVTSPFERPLAITEAKLHHIAEVWLRHEAGEKIDFTGLSAIVQQKTPRETGGHGYIVQDGVAIIDVEGILGKGMNMFMWFSGGTSTELLQKDLADAVADQGVHSIITRVDSPGGDVDGTQLFADAVREANAKKPVVAWITGLGASAAYWIASQASRIVLADETTWVGSIGVVAGHVDRSKMDEQRGVKRTEITAGKYKRIASDTAPLSQEGRQTIQDQVDAIYAVFLQNVADGRGTTPDAVHADMADGRLFMGQHAIDAGLADSIATLDQVIAQLNGDDSNTSQQPGAAASGNSATGEINMFTEEQMRAAREEEFAKGLAQGKTEGTAAGATAERARIQGVLAHSMPGHKELVTKLAFDGQTTPDQAAGQILAAERKTLAQAGVDLEADAKGIQAPASAADPVAEGKEAVKGDAKGSESTGTVITADQINARVTQAKAEGRVINVIQAKNELEAEAKAKTK